MAVVIEVFSLVLRVDRIADQFPGGWVNFEHQVIKHPSYCCDGEIVRLAFLKEEDVRLLIQDFRGAGLRHIVDGPKGRRTEDMVVVDQRIGPVSPADWLEFYHVDLEPDGSRPVPVARLKGSKETRTFFPKDWTWEGSPFGPGLS